VEERRWKAAALGASTAAAVRGRKQQMQRARQQHAEVVASSVAHAARLARALHQWYDLGAGAASDHQAKDSTTAAANDATAAAATVAASSAISNTPANDAIALGQPPLLALPPLSSKDNASFLKAEATAAAARIALAAPLGDAEKTSAAIAAKVAKAQVAQAAAATATAEAAAAKVALSTSTSAMDTELDSSSLPAFSSEDASLAVSATGGEESD